MNITKNRMPISDQSKLVGVIEKYATRFFALLIVTLCLIMFYFGPQIAPSYKGVFISVSTSLLASLIFALVYSSVVERHHMTVINDELSSSVKKAVDEIKELQQDNMQQISDLTLAKIEELEKTYYHEISLHFRELIPADYFPPTNNPDQRFNDTLNSALAKSHLYLFKGVTGRFIPSRLATVNHHNLTCKILLIDPASEDLLRLYIRDRFGNTVPNVEVTQRVQKVKQEIYMSVVDLFDQARWTSIEIKMYNGPVFYRTEIFDEYAFISYFTAKTATAFPTTYLYNKDSFFYNAFLTDFNQTFELASISTLFNSRSTEQDLLDFLTQIGCDVRELPELRKEAEQFRLEFLGKK
jgi:hypothetical protein